MGNQQLNPEVHYYFEMLPIDVKNQILESGKKITCLQDLYNIVDEMLD